MSVEQREIEGATYVGEIDGKLFYQVEGPDLTHERRIEIARREGARSWDGMWEADYLPGLLKAAGLPLNVCSERAIKCFRKHGLLAKPRSDDVMVADQRLSEAQERLNELGFNDMARAVLTVRKDLEQKCGREESKAEAACSRIATRLGKVKAKGWK